MQRINLLTFLVLVGFVLMGCGKKSTISSKSENFLDFVNVYNRLDLNNPQNTQLNVQTAWKEFQGKVVNWEGRISDMVGRRDRVEIMVAVEGGALYKDYNVVATTFDISWAGNLRKGDMIKFQGNLANYRQKKGSPLIIYLDSVKPLQK